MLSAVAGAAAYANVLTVDSISRLRVVKSFGSRIPVNHLEVNSVVIGVAFDAGGSFGCGTREACMEPLVLLNLHGNFLMALNTAKRGRPCGNLVALNAICVSIQVLVRACKGPRRNLRMSDHRQSKREGNHKCATNQPAAALEITSHI